MEATHYGFASMAKGKRRKGKGRRANSERPRDIDLCPTTRTWGEEKTPTVRTSRVRGLYALIL